MVVAEMLQVVCADVVEVAWLQLKLVVLVQAVLQRKLVVLVVLAWGGNSSPS